MVMTLTFPPNIAKQLEQLSQTQQISAEELALKFISEGLADVDLESNVELEQLVQEVQSMPPNPDAIIPAKGDLLSALQNSPEDPEFDLEQWQRQWSAVETEIQAVTRQNSVAEGRG